MYYLYELTGLLYGCHMIGKHIIYCIIIGTGVCNCMLYTLHIYTAYLHNFILLANEGQMASHSASPPLDSPPPPSSIPPSEQLWPWKKGRGGGGRYR